MYVPRFGRRRHHGGGFGLLLLLSQLYRVGFDRIPPVTLATIAAQAAIFLRFIKGLPHNRDVCISAVNVWYKEDYKRLLLGSFFHSGDMHLYFNMVSFLWKGMSLERRFGSAYFAYLLAVLSLTVNIVLVGLSFIAERLFNDGSYLMQCAVGFSGVIFALKVITTYYLPPGSTRVMGFFPVPSRLACWAELLLIQLLVPNASFLGHLAGILVGIAYTRGPLKSIMDIFMLPQYSHYSDASGNEWASRPQSNYTFHSSGQSGYRNQDYFGEVRPRDDNDLRDSMRQSEEDEDIAEAIRRSREDYYHAQSRSMSESQATPSAPPPEDHLPHDNRLYPDLSNNVNSYENIPENNEYGWRAEVVGNPVDMDDLRRRRLARFDS